ncbi:MAG: GumC family protein [Bauldia sp.]|nr:GumC family protein [Bauldia sp.]
MPSEPAAVIDLGGIGKFLRRHVILIVCSGLLAAAVAVAIYSFLPVRYQARTDLLLDPKGLNVLQNDLTSSGPQTYELAVALAQSQLRVITSSTILSRVVDQENLAADPEFTEPQQNFLTGLLHFSASPAKEALAPAEAALMTLRDRVEADLPDKTFVMELGVATESPEKSARIANAIAEAYVSDQGSSRAELAHRSSASLVATLDGLRARMEASADRVEQYRSAHNLVDAGGRSVVEQQLIEANSQLAAARVRQAEAATRYADIQSYRAGGKNLSAFPETLQSPVIAALRVQYADLKRIQAERTSQLGANHPSTSAITGQLASLEGLIEDEVKRIEETAKTDLDRAATNLAKAEETVNEMKQATLESNQTSIQLDALQREADADRAVYETFLTRSRELAEQQDVNTDNTRILSPATPPLDPMGPGRKIVAVGGFVFGILLALAIGLVIDLVMLSRRKPPKVEDRDDILPLAAE